MPKMRLKIPLFRIARRAIPLIQSTTAEFIAVRKPDSDGGKKVTLEEIQSLGLDIGFKVAAAITEEVSRANVDVINHDLHDES